MSISLVFQLSLSFLLPSLNFLYLSILKLSTNFFIGVSCPKAGKAAYSDAVRTSSNLSVIANNFFAFHTVLKTSEDYYEAMR